jgi:hypothetical protein
LRQRTNKKPGATTLQMPTGTVDVPDIPNPDGREWHALTVQAWARAWASPMASQWIETDVDALGRLALIWDAFYQSPDAKVLAEIRLQEQRFGLSPLDRTRLQWEVARTEGAERTQARRKESVARTGTNDPRAVLMAVK